MTDGSAPSVASIGQHCLCGQREAVIGHEHTVDGAAGSGEQLLEDDAALFIVRDDDRIIS